MDYVSDKYKFDIERPLRAVEQNKLTITYEISPELLEYLLKINKIKMLIIKNTKVTITQARVIS